MCELARPSSDPYCVLSVGSQRYVSNAVKKTLDPNWNQLFGFQNVQAGDKLVLSVWDKDTAGHDDSLGDGIVELAGLPVGKEVFFLVKLVGGDSGENLHEAISDNVQPVSQNIAAIGVQNAIGGEAGKLVGHVIKKIPQGEEDKNCGTVAVGVLVASPLGNHNPAQIQRSIPATSVPEVEQQLDRGCPP